MIIFNFVYNSNILIIRELKKSYKIILNKKIKYFIY
jgi:hypothetical protein